MSQTRGFSVGVILFQSANAGGFKMSFAYSLERHIRLYKVCWLVFSCDAAYCEIETLQWGQVFNGMALDCDSLLESL